MLTDPSGCMMLTDPSGCMMITWSCAAMSCSQPCHSNPSFTSAPAAPPTTSPRGHARACRRQRPCTAATAPSLRAAESTAPRCRCDTHSVRVSQLPPARLHGTVGAQGGGREYARERVAA
eukprot:3427438-Rhodomonas_salina.1